MTTARKSKRLHASAAEAVPAGKCYKAGIYARLSSNQDEKKKESIDAQVAIARKFVEDWNKTHADRIEVAGCFMDLGKTGTNFNREEFGRLMQEIRLGEINCVIVKDLSRFGRNYLEAGNYIEKIFPFLGVRFIAVADGYDTGADGKGPERMSASMAVGIKNLVNDMYAEDFSKKAKIGLKQRRKEGSYVGGPPPYGYTAVWEGRIRKLKPDENTADIVRGIYSRFLETGCYQTVIDELNERRLNPPAVYKKTGKVYALPDMEYKGWNQGSVERILKSETYMGKLVQGRTAITARDERNRVLKDSVEWVVAENAHEELVDPEIFEEAAKIRRRIRQKMKKKKSPSKGIPIGENAFESILYCGVCGRKMTRSSHVKHDADGNMARLDGYFCLNAASAKTDQCPKPNRISKAGLVKILFVLIESEFSMNLGRQKNYVEKSKEYIRQAELELERELRSAKNAVSSLNEEGGRKYMEYRAGVISQKEYMDDKTRKEGQLAGLEKARRELEERQERLAKKEETYRKAVRSLLRWKQKKELTKELVGLLIEKIYVYPGRRVEVVFWYTDAFQKETAWK